MFSAAPFLSTLLDRVKAVVRRVARPVVARTRGAPADVTTDRPVSSMMRARMKRWLSARLGALTVLMRRIEAGEAPPAPVRAAHASRSACGAETHRRAPVPAAARLPRGLGWICAIGPNLRQDGQAFADWFDEPWMRAKVMAAPEEMARRIGPILHATGACPPAWFPVVPKKVRARREVGPVVSPEENVVPGEGSPESRDVSDSDGGRRDVGTDFTRTITAARTLFVLMSHLSSSFLISRGTLGRGICAFFRNGEIVVRETCGLFVLIS
jgi:hypothetical protein